MFPDHPIGWLVFTISGACALGSIELLLVGLVRTWWAGRNGEETLQRVDVLTREGNATEALAVARRLRGSVAGVVVAGLRAADEATSEQAMADAAIEERKRLMADVRALDVLGAIAVLLPLVGTAIMAGLGDAAIPAEEWRWALLLLAVGFGTAIVATLGRFWLTARIRRLAVDMAKGAALVYNTAR